MDSWLLPFAGIWLALVNLAAWTAFALDKAAAQEGARRTPERTLLLLALIGGSPAALAARQLLRHKTRKEPFRSLLLAIVCLQGLAILAAIALSTSWRP
ncbi:MAG: DUF1294 domain-containing protein [Pseudomonadota bacterium]